MDGNALLPIANLFAYYATLLGSLFILLGVGVTLWRIRRHGGRRGFGASHTWLIVAGIGVLLVGAVWAWRWYVIVTGPGSTQ